MPPAPEPATPSGIVAKAGSDERVIPTSVRADGSVRKERKVRPGFTPQEDVARFRPSRVRQAEGQGTAPRRAGVGWSEAQAAQPAEESTKASPRQAAPRVRPPRAEPQKATKKPQPPAAPSPAAAAPAPTKDTMPEWRSTARPRTTRSSPARSPLPRPSQAERGDASSPSKWPVAARTETQPEAGTSLDALGESLSTLSIKVKRL